jgi:hypothetical protein
MQSKLGLFGVFTYNNLTALVKTVGSNMMATMNFTSCTIH